jgi:hypothetical protein
LRVFVGRNGQELISEDDWKRNVKDDIVLLVSAGEEYVGIKRESFVHGKFNFEHICAGYSLPRSVTITDN